MIPQRNYFIQKIFSKLPFKYFYTIFRNDYFRKFIKLQSHELNHDIIERNLTNAGIKYSASVVCRNVEKIIFNDYYDTFKYKHLNKNNLSNYIEYEGLSNFVDCYEAGNSIILYSGHFGRIIMPLIGLGVMGYKVGLMTADPFTFPNNERSFQIFKLNCLKKIMGGPFYTTDSYLKSVFTYLDSDSPSVFSIIIDTFNNSNYKSGSNVRFLNHYVDLPSGICRIARKTHSFVVPYFSFEYNSKVKCMILEPIKLDNVDDNKALELLLKPLENNIIKKPDHWWNWHELK